MDVDDRNLLVQQYRTELKQSKTKRIDICFLSKDVTFSYCLPVDLNIGNIRIEYSRIVIGNKPIFFESK